MKKHLFTILFMVGITFVAVSLVSGTHLLTANVISRNETIYRRRAVFEALTISMPDNPALFETFYTERVTEIVDSNNHPVAYRVLLTDEHTSDNTALVVHETGAGLWGTISALVGFDTDAQTYRGVVFLSHSETPGLGARIDEPWFREQFAGRKGPFDRLGPEPQDKQTPSRMAGRVDQITGATTSSEAVMTIMNKSRLQVQSLADARNTP